MDAAVADPRSSASQGATASFARSVTPRVLVANVLAAMVVFFFLWVVSPTGNEDGFGIELIALGVYIVGSSIIGILVGKRTFGPVAAWLDSDRAPSESELEATLDQPLHQARWVFLGWLGGAVTFGGFHVAPNSLHHDPDYGLFIGAVVVLGGLAAAMFSYLLIEQRLRPIFALALEQTAPIHPRTLGVQQRLLVAWALGSGVVFVAISLTPFTPTRPEAIWLLAPIGLVGGGVIIAFAARAVAGPVVAMRQALARVEQGDLDARVDVDDGSEVGVLQAGFNRMVSGLREREQLRSIFGTYVDPDIAEHILSSGTSLAGEEVDVTILFLDIREFTAFAERVPPQEVVATLNRLFERIVPIIHEHGGHVDKFVGDGVLAVFGAPRRHAEHADLSVRAAIDIRKAVAAEFAELRVAIGINSGMVVAGNVGGGGRLEFSVIGDVVNVAQRVEGATRSTGDSILVSQATKDRLRDPHIAFVERHDIQLKGKSEPVCLFAVD